MSKIDVAIMRPLEYPCLTYTTIEDDLHTFYDIIGCSTIDIPIRRFCGIPLCFILDDEGLFADKVEPSVLLPADEVFVGNVIICCQDGEDLASLPRSLFEFLSSRVGDFLIIDGIKHLLDLR